MISKKLNQEKDVEKMFEEVLGNISDSSDDTVDRERKRLDRKFKTKYYHPEKDLVQRIDAIVRCLAKLR